MLKVLTITELTSLRAYLKPRVIHPDLCDGTLKHTYKWLRARKPLCEEGVIKWLESQGALCDCEVWYNVPRRHRAHVPKPDEVVAMQDFRRPSEGYPPDWGALTKAIRKRDNYKCAIPAWCEKGQHEGTDVHHINYRKDDNRWENLITLCRSCHGTIHGKTGRYREYWESHLSSIAIEKTRAVGAGGGGASGVLC